MRSLDPPVRFAAWALTLALTGCGTGCGASQAGSAGGATAAIPAPSSPEPAPTDAAQRLAVAEQASAAGRDGGAEVHAHLAPMPIVSFGVPSFASSGDAGQANDRSYDTTWQSKENTAPSSPSWIAYDLSGVPAAQRGQVDVVWDNGSGGYNDYDIAAQKGDAYNQPRDYLLEGNAAPGGSPPSASWVTLATVRGNTYASRGHAVNLAGYNWLRMTVTAINGTTYNMNVSINLDVHDASRGVGDAWLFLGDSITSFALRNDGAGIGAKSFGELINAGKPAYFPAAEGAGEGGWSSSTPLTAPSPDGHGSLFDHWISTFPGKFVCLSYGTNDGTDGSNDATGTYNNLVTMVKKLIAAGKTPCIPHVPWARDEAHQKNARLVNLRIDGIYAEFPQVVKGPDLWAVTANQASLFQDELHPNPKGREAFRQAWAKAMLTEVYP